MKNLGRKIGKKISLTKVKINYLSIWIINVYEIKKDPNPKFGSKKICSSI